MPKHRQPTPAARRARPALVTAGALTILCTATGIALAATAPTPVATPAPTASTTTHTSTSAASDSTSVEDVVDSATVPPSSAPPEEVSSTSTGSSSMQADDGTWLSGASGDGAADGALGEWRGEPVDIVGTWADQGGNQTQLWSIAPGGEVADFDGAIDIAPGGLQDGDTWAAAADGAYDDRWQESLTRMSNLRAEKGTTYIRPFHEFNLDGWNWSVSLGDAEDFTAAWKRYRAIQREVFPEAQLVYGVNVTSSGTDLDWRTTWPGEGQADVLGVDSYNGWPTISTVADFKAQLEARGDDGIPIGLNAYSEQAEEWGVPLAVPEWSGRADMGDEPAYVTAMVDWFAANAGSGPGQVVYEILFNAPQDDRNFQLFTDGSRMPASAKAYVDAVQATADGQGAGVHPAGTGASIEPRDAATVLTDSANPASGASEEPAPVSADPTSVPADFVDQAESLDQADVDALVARLDALLDRLEQT